tara:strand:- start:33693 stop:34196 length:504 start_codon:yes stop_codon:yes gene_type:complete
MPKNKLKYQKPLFHSSILWSGFIISSFLIGMIFYHIFPKQLFLILGFIIISINASIFFNLLTPYFYSNKYKVKGLTDFVIYERCDFFTISFSGDSLHNEYIPAYFKGYIVSIEEMQNGRAFEGFAFKIKKNSEHFNEFFVLNQKLENLKNIEKLYQKIELKNKISYF